MVLYSLQKVNVMGSFLLFFRLVVSEEGFWNKGNKIFNYMKIRGAYGEVGNDKIGSDKYYYLQTYPLLTSNRPSFGLTNNPENRIYEGKEGNTDVTWERARKLNVGIDMRLLIVNWR